MSVFIKKIRLYNFKSFKGKAEYQFEEGNNILVGKNGSGKSNFLQAIEFVIGDDRKYLQHEKLALFYGGRGNSMSVEITFGNFKSRIMGSDELSICRVIDNKTEVYYINRKKSNHRHVITILELYGFCLPKPYYFLHNSRKAIMVFNSHTERVKYIINSMGAAVTKTVAKLNRYSRQLKELKIKIDEFEAFVKLNAADENDEDKEMKIQYRKLKGLRNALHVLIEEKQIEEWSIKKNLLLVAAWNEDQLSFKFNDVKQDIIKTMQSLAEIKDKQNYLEDLKKDIVKEQNGLLREKAKLTLTLEDINTTKQLLASEKEEYKDNDAIENRVILLTSQLEEINDSFVRGKKKLEEKEEFLAVKSQHIMDLISIESHGKERDKWIDKRLREVSNEIKSSKEKRDNFIKLRSALYDLKIKYDKRMKELKEGSQKELQLLDTQNNIKAEYCTLLSKLNDIRREESETEHSLVPLHKAKTQRKIQLRIKYGSSIVNGYESVKTILKNWKLQNSTFSESYYGTVIENIKCDDALNISLDAAGGKRLFYHIVQNERVGTEILKEMGNLQLLGEVWFIPLDKISVNMRSFLPSELRAVPLIDKLDYEERVEKAMQYVFGNIMICKNIEAAVEIAQLSGNKCITLSGDKVEKGVISGGYVNINLSGREIFLDLLNVENKILSKLDEIELRKEKIYMLETKINEKVTSLEKIKAQRKFEGTQTELKLVEEKFNNIVKEISDYDISLQEINTTLKKLDSTRKILSEKLEKGRHSNAGETIQELNALNKERKTLKKEIDLAKIALIAIENDKAKSESELKLYLQKRDSKEQNNSELKKLTAKLKHCEVKIGLTDERLRHLDKQLGCYETELSEIKSQEHDEQVDLDRLQDLKNNLMQSHSGSAKDKIKVYDMRINESKKRIQKINLVDRFEEEKYNEYKNMRISELSNELSRVQDELKAYSNMNEKAGYSTEESIQLIKLLKSSINEFNAGTAVFQTFKEWWMNHILLFYEQISEKFNAIFIRLIPDSSAVLIVETKNSEEEDEYIFENLFEVKICVTFPNQQPIWDINLLSGGEKGIVFLAIVFAFMQLSPSPFYVLDEVDRALDVDYKFAVGGLMSELSKNIQMFTSSHFPELISDGKKYFSVSFENMVSHLNEISKEEALNIINLYSSFSNTSTSSAS